MNGNIEHNRVIDVLVIGGGGAGSAAAVQLGRVRRSVVVVDSGEPRNAPAAHMQGYLGHDGAAPADFLARAHNEVRAYGTEIVGDRIIGVTETTDRLVCTTAAGRTYRARRILVATGLRDLLPEIPGVAEHWGDRVIHCPWCHGWEARDQRIAVIDSAPATEGTPGHAIGPHQALLFAQLSDRVTLVANPSGMADDQRERLRLGGVAIVEGPATAITTGEDGNGLAVSLRTDGAADRVGDGSGERVLQVDVAVVAPRFAPNVSMVEHLVDVDDHPSGMGRHVVVDEVTGTTSHPRIFAAGNVADPMQQVLHAAAHGSRVATMINMSLLEDDIENARRTESDQQEWDRRYTDRGEQMWSGQPNGSLVGEVAGLPPGRALDVGCGEGADAVWLAEQGWEVTGTDISTIAIERARAAATARSIDVAFAVADGLADPPPPAAFDLVTVSYPAFPRPRGLAAFGTIADAVVPGGCLLVIGHVLDDDSLRTATEHGFDPDRYLSLDDIVEIVAPDFTIEVDETRERPNAPADAHHSQDRILLARRVSRDR